MKTAITSTGNTPNARVDQRFGRCSYFAIYDDETDSIEYLPNPNKEADEGAGPASLQLVASKGVTKVISGEFGANVKTVFDSLRIQLVILNNSDKTINDIIKLVISQKAKGRRSETKFQKTEREK